MKLLHLYPDLMNLYGDGGNLRALERRLTDQGEEIVIRRAAPGDALALDGYDFLYMGPGTERSRKAALEALRPYAGALKEAMEGGVHALFTGNSASLMGREIVDADGVSRPGLGLLEFTARERRDTRCTGDAIFRHPDLPDALVGFVNKCEDWEGDVPPLFQTVMGRGNRADTVDEGFRRKNFLGTHLIGPVLVKNPHFHNWLLRRLLGRELKPVDYPYEERAWQVTFQALMARQEAK